MKETRFKQTEIGLIPEDWGVSKLGEKCLIYRGGSPRTGRTANTIRYIYDQNGNLVEKQDMGNSTYKMRPKIVLYNPADGDPATWVNGVPPTPESQPASGTESSSAPENSTSEPSGTQNNNTTNSAVNSGNNGQDAGAQLPQPEPAPEPVLPISPTPPSGTTGT